MTSALDVGTVANQFYCQLQTIMMSALCVGNVSKSVLLSAPGVPILVFSMLTDFFPKSQTRYVGLKKKVTFCNWKAK